MLAGKNLIIRFLYLGKYGLFACISGSAGNGGVNIYKGTDEAKQVLVEISQKIPLLLVEGREVIGVVLKEGTLPVAALQGVPMQMPPVPVVADTDIAHQGMRRRLFYGDTKRKGTLWAVYQATVAEGLLAVMVVYLKLRLIGPKECRIMRYRSQIATRQYH